MRIVRQSGSADRALQFGERTKGSRCRYTDRLRSVRDDSAATSTGRETDEIHGAGARVIGDTLVDACVLSDVAIGNPKWDDWSADPLEQAGARGGRLLVDPIIDAEVSIAFDRIEDVDALLPETVFYREALPCEAAFLPGKAFHAYRRQGGARTLPLPDFFIGTQAALSGYPVPTRDAARFRTHYQTVELVMP